MTSIAPSRQLLLIVDDEPEILDALIHIAAKSPGTLVMHASSAESAEEVFAHHSVAALLTDVRMPGRSGIELVQSVRARHAPVRCALMTGYHEDVIDGVRLGSLDLVAVLRKPFRAHEARDLIFKLTRVAPS